MFWIFLALIWYVFTWREILNGVQTISYFYIVIAMAYPVAEIIDGNLAIYFFVYPGQIPFSGIEDLTKTR